MATFVALLIGAAWAMAFIAGVRTTAI